ncbi:TetR family transcriptional regulator [Paractinoplanes abujensis]|uniref:AcrR family transcriptional regulator n=1 Tax=Paractinoplanes abujensis TaxID=882441 RepID=A0A7W7CPK3_9ACTN|nr:TetR/AcrR family transcriptional regulator [Actinoplanes abujensis]MBB4690873.1 AcrR family transcriptional regulator [Actinoplanes abujensis]GID17714.1 TetR family transcriptional regulator [Actinoplanes abujensis]
MSLNTRRRGADLEDAILDAAWAVLIDSGYNGFTFEAIAARAGTSRPVLYRRWPHRDDLLVATLRRHWASRPIEVPDTGSLRADAIGFLRNVDQGRTGLMTLISAQLVEYFRATGTNFRDLRDSLRPPGQPTGFARIVGRAVERGEIPDVTRSPRIIDLPFDLFRNEMLMTMRPVSTEWITETVDLIWLPLLRAT